jgi:leucyl/phenylalanyl-tRNA--protein transferase
LPVFQLSEDIVFPQPDLANESGLLAIGGDLSPDRLLLAYQMGIFPWFDEKSPIMWHAPDPRCVLYPKDFKIRKSLKKAIQRGGFTICFDKDFELVIRYCAEVPRKGQMGTWITSSKSLSKQMVNPPL